MGRDGGDAEAVLQKMFRGQVSVERHTRRLAVPVDRSDGAATHALMKVLGAFEERDLALFDVFVTWTADILAAIAAPRT